MSGIRRYFGIDFGTTNSAMVGIIETSEGKNFVRYKDEVGGPFPSLIAIDKMTGATYCGRAAWQQRRELSESCEIISSVKSYLGTDKIWKIAGEIWTPERVATQLFLGLKENAREKYNTEIDEAVISVPVGFSSKKREALRKAAKLAGIEIKNFVSEPTSAIIKNFESLKKFSKVAVFDWGGGTLDVSVVEIKGGHIYELSVAGLSVGGDDIDLKLAQWAHTKAATKKNLNISFEDMLPRYQDKMLVGAERAKRNLCDEDSTSITILKYGELGSINIQVDIDTFSKLIDPIVENAIFTLEEAVKKAGLSMLEIDCILMVGGSSNLRPLLEKVEDRWSEQYIEFPENTEWNVAEGAALLSINPGGFRLNQEIGLILSDDSFYPIKNKHDYVPCEIQYFEFGIVEDSREARFIFSDNTRNTETNNRKILGFVSVPTYGFANEKIILEAHIDENLIFKANIKSNHRTNAYIRSFELTNIKFYYELPEMVV